MRWKFWWNIYRIFFGEFLDNIFLDFPILRQLSSPFFSCRMWLSLVIKILSEDDKFYHITFTCTHNFHVCSVQFKFLKTVWNKLITWHHEATNIFVVPSSSSSLHDDNSLDIHKHFNVSHRRKLIIIVTIDEGWEGWYMWFCLFRKQVNKLESKQIKGYILRRLMVGALICTSVIVYFSMVLFNRH